MEVCLIRVCGAGLSKGRASQIEAGQGWGTGEERGQRLRLTTFFLLRSPTEAFVKKRVGETLSGCLGEGDFLTFLLKAPTCSGNIISYKNYSVSDSSIFLKVFPKGFSKYQKFDCER